MSYSTVHIDVKDEEPPQFHCVYSHVPGEFSVKVAGGDNTVYIAGTFTQLHNWATQFVASLAAGIIAVNEQESETANA